MKVDSRNITIVLTILALIAIFSVVYEVWLLALGAVLAFSVLIYRRSRSPENLRVLSRTQYLVFLSVVLIGVVAAIAVKGA
ncbi:hypothetical protein JJV70_10165 [Streptomyces sp. JJ66]|uniref:hypothetical protein n=1 Tax=Streptomyces sp. JJ66 TaxID=2803843 RepID=UPI001C57EA94|nr:hypothetical protein [Streptomyces sp. JJ66]MBW1602468.1 hypothetical protein [Streptomyces sp. JJ66]